MTTNKQLRVRATLVSALLTVWAMAAVQAWSAEQAGRSVNDGVYAAAQAARGGQVFEKSCTMCHDPGRFTGDAFVTTWAGKPLHGLFEVVSTSMPEDNPGSLKPQEYADVLAYFLQLNKYPAGPEELKGTPEAMRAIVVEARK
jgi:mono/diheme cytochrome c family protein